MYQFLLRKRERQKASLEKERGRSMTQVPTAIYYWGGDLNAKIGREVGYQDQ